MRWPARIEVVSRRPTVILDAAHNVASIEALMRVLDESISAERRILVFATTRDKDVRGMLEVLMPKFDEIIFTRYWNNPRGLSPETMAKLAAEVRPDGWHIASSAAEAWQRASQIARPADLICITGSFFIAAEMRTAMQDTAS
jgi:dihydrofolate synthase/folylpolyglutamate synthase